MSEIWWPPHWSELSPCDFYLVGIPKYEVHLGRLNSHSLEEVKVNNLKDFSVIPK
jgi:hypothetical protein